MHQDIDPTSLLSHTQQLEILQRAIKVAELETARSRAELAKFKTVLMMNQLRPSYQMPVNIRREGSRWLCIMATSKDFMDCPMAYGDCPHEAMLNFDFLWQGRYEKLKPQDHDSSYPKAYYGDEEDEGEDYDFEEEF